MLLATPSAALVIDDFETGDFAHTSLSPTSAFEVGGAGILGGARRVSGRLASAELLLSAGDDAVSTSISRRVSGVNGGGFVSFSYDGVLDGGASNEALGVDLSPFDRFQIEIGGSVSSLGPVNARIVVFGDSGGVGSPSFTVQAPGVLEIPFSSWFDPTIFSSEIDRISLTLSNPFTFRTTSPSISSFSAVPEPNTALLLAAGLVGVGATARGRRRRTAEARKVVPGRLPGLALGVLALSAPDASAALFDGSSSSTPGYSANQILQDGFSTGDGLYWIDTDGSGGAPAFQIQADMTTAGGGWTTGLLSLAGDPSSSADLIQITGTAGIADSHTRDLTQLAIDQPAAIRHVLVDLQGATVFDGYYTGVYHDRLGDASDWTILAGDLSALGVHVGVDWSTISNDVDDWVTNCAATFGFDWYYTACFNSSPVNPLEAFGVHSGPISSGLELASWTILVRETNTPVLVPEPGTATLVLLGVAAVAGRRRRR